MYILFCLTVLVISALAAPSSLQSQRRDGYTLKSAHPVSSKWLQISRAPQSHTIGLRIALKQKSFDGLANRLNQVADPHHEDYGKWMKDEDVHSYISPNKDTSSAVKAWLAEHGLNSFGTSPSGDWIYVPVTVEQAEHLLDTKYYTYKHVETGSELVRTSEYSLPKDLIKHIDVVAPTNYFGDVQAMRRSVRLIDQERKNCNESQPAYGSGPPEYQPGPGQQSSSSASSSSSFSASYSASSLTSSSTLSSPSPPFPSSPSSNQTAFNISAVCNPNEVTNLCIRNLYNTINYKPQVPEQNFVSMTAYLNESANISDFHIFLSSQRKDASLDYTFNVTSINDGINFQDAEPEEYYRVRDLEGNLDAQTIGGIIYPTSFEVYSTGGSPPFFPDYSTPTNTNEPYLEWLNYMLAQERSALPNTVSTSYSDDEQTVPFDYATRVCQDFAQLTSKGITLLFSSGDSGVGENGTCYTNDNEDTPTFIPMFPPSCPYVTVVGGTRNFQPEIVAYDTRNGYVSGSGISNYFGTPDWQKEALTSYVNEIGGLHAGLYNSSGRAYPDVSAQGFRYVIVYAGEEILLDGTSAAAPTMTAVLSLVNDALIAAGKPTLGFINPWLYKFGWRGFTDILSGSTWGCDTSGFPAKKGWDVASGWGTPDFLKIKSLVVNGPPVNAPWK